MSKPLVLVAPLIAQNLHPFTFTISANSLRVTVNVKMKRLLLFLIACSWPSSAIIHIEKHILEFDESIGSAETTYFHEVTGNSITNVTFRTFKTITKAFLYLNVRLATDKDDRDYKFELIKTVIDFGSFLKGAQGNPLLRAFIENIKRSFDFEIVFPAPPVSTYIYQNDIKIFVQKYEYFF